MFGTASASLFESLLRIELSVPVSPFEAAGAVLGLLLVLRVNTGYSRWWEARILWGGIVNQTRNLAISGLAYGPRNTRWRSRFIRWIAVSSEIAMLLYEARNMGMDGYAFHNSEVQRATLIDHLGGCERILKTPLARSSAIQVRQFIFLLLITLPMGLMQDLEVDTVNPLSIHHSINQVWIVPLYVMLLAYPLLSLDRIGMELQNPFSTQRIDFLPLDSICTMIERNVLELLHDIENQQAAAPRPGDVALPPDAEISEQHGTLRVDIS